MKQLVFTDIDEAVRAYKKLPAGKKRQIIIRDAKDQRSIEQNNLYWFWVGILSRHTGDFPKKVSFQLKRHLLTPTIIELFDGTFEKQYPSTASMSVKELQEYLDAIDIWCITFCGFALPKKIYTETR